MRWSLICGVVLFSVAPLLGELPTIERVLPPPGIEIPAEARRQLIDRLAALQKRIEPIKDHALIADVLIYEKAVRYALEFGEFYKKGDEKVALKLLDEADARAAALARNEHPWTTQRGLVVRGYTSDIDGSPLPYGLHIPESLDLSHPVPLYVWLHGRNAKGTDLHFIHERMTKVGQVAPADAITLHPFGRQCVGWKSAGEIDALDAIDSVSGRYRIDAERVALLGFSMGGAGAWHIGAHYADRFCAVHAGAGFVDVKEFLNLDPSTVPEIERQLWGMYDVPAYVRNLFSVPVIAYSGEIDKQKEAADIMARAYAEHGRELPYVIGAGMGHKYDEASLKQVLAFVGDAVKRGRNRHPMTFSLQTQTLRYNRMHWIEVLGLERHWAEARVDVEVAPGDERVVKITTKNVTEMRVGNSNIGGTRFTIDGQKFDVSKSSVHPPLLVAKTGDGKWEQTPPRPEAIVVKSPGLQGPIDDAFMSPFMFVLPDGKSKSPAVQRWVEAESAHQIRRWRETMRGDTRVKRADEVTEDDARRYHLVLWGDLDSNSLIARAAHMLPIMMDNVYRVHHDSFDARTHVVAMIAPNHMAPGRYIVLNSGLTFREEHDRNNSLQNPHLGDWAIIDITTPADGFYPGKVVKAGFFDERWQLPAAK